MFSKLIIDSHIYYENKKIIYSQLQFDLIFIYIFTWVYLYNECAQM